MIHVQLWKLSIVSLSQMLLVAIPVEDDICEPIVLNLPISQ